MLITASDAVKYLRRGAITLAVFVVSTVASGFILALGDERGWFKHPTSKISATMGELAIFAHWMVASPWVHWTGGAIIGFAAGVWLDSALRRMAAREAKTPKAMPEKGSLDYQQDLLVAQARLKAITDRLTSEQNKLTQQTVRYTGLIQRFTSTHHPNHPHFLAGAKKLTGGMADKLNDYSDRLESLKQRLSRQCRDSEHSVSVAVSKCAAVERK